MKLEAVLPNTDINATKHTTKIGKCCPRAIKKGANTRKPLTSNQKLASAASVTTTTVAHPGEQATGNTKIIK